MTRHPTLAIPVAKATTSSSGGGGGDTNNTTVTVVAKKVLDAAKDALGRMQRRRSDLRFSKDALVADATANYRRKIGQPLVEKLPAKTPAKINEFLMHLFMKIKKRLKYVRL